jgi:beta-glucanase (GH16 family)
LFSFSAAAATGQKLDESGLTPTFSDDFSTSQQYHKGGPMWNAAPVPFKLNNPSFAWQLGYYNMEIASAGAPSSFPNSFFPAYSALSNELEVYPDYDQVTAGGIVPFTRNPGLLDIMAQPMPLTLAPSVPAKLPGKYLSEAFTTYPTAQKYGYFEMKAKLPSGRGLWPAFWLLPLSGSGELDVMETLCQDTTTYYATIHSSGIPQGALGSTIKTADLSAGFHTFGADWGPQQVIFYLDRVEVARVSTPPDMHQPYYMLFNLAVGGNGSWPGAPDSTTKFPAHFQIAYVKVWQRPQYATAP